VRTKCTGKTYVGLWGNSCGRRELPGVGGPGLGEAGHYKWYHNRLSQFHRRMWSSCVGMVCMAGVGPEWSHGMVQALALEPRTSQREDVPGLGLIDEDIDLLRGFI
jgi:hypothetical protein